MPLKLIPPHPGRSPNYRIRGTYLGLRVDRSCETGEKETAKKLIAAIKAAIERGAFAQKPSLSLAAAITSYVQAGGEDRFLEPILRYFGKGATVKEIDQAAADAAATAIYPHAAPGTRNRQFYTPLLAVLRHAGVASGIRRPKGAAGNARMVWLRPEEFERLVKAARTENLELVCLLTLLVFTGLRLGEALGLRCRDVDLDQASAFCGKTKNGEPRAVYLPPRVIAALANHPRGLGREGRIFGWHKDGKLYSLARHVYAAASVGHGGAPFHVLRHTYGAWMTRIGADLVATGAWKSSTAARVYQHFSFNEEARKADELPGADIVER